MFEVGFTEILLIGALALIVLGPQRLPKLAAQVGRWAGRARAMARQFRDQLDQEVNLETTFGATTSHTQQTRNGSPQTEEQASGGIQDSPDNELPPHDPIPYEPPPEDPAPTDALSGPGTSHERTGA